MRSNDGSETQHSSCKESFGPVEMGSGIVRGRLQAWPSSTLWRVADGVANTDATATLPSEERILIMADGADDRKGS